MIQDLVILDELLKQGYDRRVQHLQITSVRPYLRPLHYSLIFEKKKRHG